MLVLSRRPDEMILLPSVPAVIKVISSGPGVVRLGIEAPSHVPILREELARKDVGATSAQNGGELPVTLSHLIRNRLHNVGLGLALLRIQLGEECSEEVQQVLDGMEQEMETLRRALAASAAGNRSGEPPPLAVQPVA